MGLIVSIIILFCFVIANATTIGFSTFVGGDNLDYYRGVKVNSDGSNVTLAGFCASNYFPTTSGSYGTIYNGGQRDVMISKIDSSGSFLLFSTFLGGNDEERTYTMELDESENSYIGGYTFSNNFPTTTNAFDETHNGNYDAFVTKVNSMGNALIYSTFIGGNSEDKCRRIDVHNGIAYITGRTSSNNFPIVSSSYDTTYNGGSYDAFFCRVAPNGTALEYSTFLGGSNYDDGDGIKFNFAEGAVYISGYTASNDFPITTWNAYDTSLNGNVDCFITRLLLFNTSPEKNETQLSGTNDYLFDYSTFLGGSGNDYNRDIKVESFASVYGTGYTYSSDFPLTAGGFDDTYSGGEDTYIFELDLMSNNLIFSTFLGGSQNDQVYVLETDTLGFTYVTGYTFSGDFPTTVDAFDTLQDGDNDGFFTILPPLGDSLVYSTFLGGSAKDIGGCIAISPQGDIYIGGDTSSPDFIATNGAYDYSHNGTSDATITKFVAFSLKPNGYSTPIILNFGDVQLNNLLTLQAKIFSTGEIPLSVTNYNLVGDGFDVDLATSAISVGDSLEFNLTFEPQFLGFSAGYIEIFTNDWDTPNYLIYLSGIGVDTVTTVEENSLPEKIELLQNYPNPFNPSTKIDFTLQESQNISLNIFNVKGQLVKTLFSGFSEKGLKSLTWDSKDSFGNLVSSGTYFYKLETETGFSETKKMSFLR
ncbi:MAG: T9SS C-terminal target domain-containing protein [Calditrichaeota bacterium]|nr:MAG: T9SS C-terminal target domain-containing protein [Calditrichota bacterium]